MPHPLDGCLLRLKRADEHLSFLDEEISAFLKQVDRRLVGQFNRETSEYIFRVTGDPPRGEWGILVSEFAHHLRALLDELVWQLVILRGGTPRGGQRGSTFPILDKKGKWDSQRTKDALQGTSTEDRAIIESVQPYHRTFEDPLSEPVDMVWSHPLWQLDCLNRADKHHFLQPAFLVAESMQPVSPDGTLFRFGNVQDVGHIDPGDIHYVRRRPDDEGTEILSIRLRCPGPDPHMEMDSEVALTVSLKDGDPLYVWHTLRDIRVYTEKQVLQRLAPAFDT